MAKNDIILIDSIIQKLKETDIESEGKIFEYLAIKQIVKDYSLSLEEIELGIVDGRNDAGIDGIYVMVNGENVREIDNFTFPKTDIILEIYIITCKHHDTFKMQPIDSIYTAISELLNFSIDTRNLVAKYNDGIIEQRNKIYEIYKKAAFELKKLKINLVYASRGDTKLISDNILAKAEQTKELINEYFSQCDVNFSFMGSKEILELHRKTPITYGSLRCTEVISEDNNYIVLCNLYEFYKFIIDENKKVKKYLFDSNVRDYIKESEINDDICETLLKVRDKDFWLFNNGITILANSANMIGKIINMKNIQIVNGLQTTNSIYEYFNTSGSDQEKRNVLIKIIVSEEDKLRDSIIRATNNQNEIKKYNLHATDKMQRDIEEIMLENNLYYERRENYYFNQEMPRDLICTPDYIAAGFVSLILKLPNLTLRQKYMYRHDYYAIIFSNNVDIQIWPIIAKILKKTDKILIKEKNNRNLKIDKFLIKLRCIIAFLTVSKLMKTYNFSAQDLLKFDVSKYKEKQILEMLDNVLEMTNSDIQWKDATKRSFTLDICKKIGEKYKIADYEIIKNKQSVLDGFDYKLDEKFILEVKERLPVQPWKRDMHKKIAKKLKCQDYEVSKAIDILIERKEVYRQKDGKIYDYEGNIMEI